MDSIKNNGLNFTARLDLRFCTLKTNASRWKDISQKLPQLTEEFPNDILVVSEESSKRFKDLEITLSNIETKSNAIVNIGENSYKKLLKLTDEEIAGKFKKLLQIFKHRDDTYAETNKFLNKLKENDTMNTVEDIEDEIMETIGQKVAKDTQIALNKDKILKDSGIWFC